jgi:hypothetical protein
MEQATVSGLLSTLNEDAQEDILKEEINNAREEAELGVDLDRPRPEDSEADVLYYTNPSSGGMNPRQCPAPLSALT